MNVSIDAELCTGCEVCVSIAPDLFEMQEDKAIVKSAGIDASQADQCKEAAESCPVEAIKIEE